MTPILLETLTLTVTVSPFAPLALVQEYVTLAAEAGTAKITDINITNAATTANILFILFKISPRKDITL